MPDYRPIGTPQDGAELQVITSGNANEFVYDLTKTGDAGKLRFGVRDHLDSMCISIDHIEGEGDTKRRREMGYIKFGHDDNYPKDVPVMCLEVSLTKPDSDGGDAGEITVLRLGLRRGLEILGGLPGGGSSGGNNDGGAPSRFVSPNGRYWSQPVQDDGNGVVYDAIDPNHPKAIFDMWWLMGVLAKLGHHYPGA